MLLVAWLDESGPLAYQVVGGHELGVAKRVRDAPIVVPRVLISQIMLAQSVVQLLIPPNEPRGKAYELGIFHAPDCGLHSSLGCLRMCTIVFQTHGWTRVQPPDPAPVLQLFLGFP